MTDRHGWYTDISSVDYHSGPGLSTSGMKALLRSPAHFKAPAKEETPAMIEGEAFHCYGLQPELFNKRFAVMPQGQDRRTKEGKALAADAEAVGMTVISYDTFAEIKGMTDAIRAHPLVAEILSEGQPEVSGYVTDPGSGVLLKCRIDWLCTSRNLLFDLKSTADSSIDAFTGIAYKMGYALQAAVYLYVTSLITKVEHREFLFVAVEREPPHGVVVYQADQEFIQFGQIQMQRAIAIYKDCEAQNHWPAYSQELHNLGLPIWARKSIYG